MDFFSSYYREFPFGTLLPDRILAAEILLCTKTFFKENLTSLKATFKKNVDLTTKPLGSFRYHFKVLILQC